MNRATVERAAQRFAFWIVIMTAITASQTGQARADSADDLVQTLNYPAYYDGISKFAVQAAISRIQDARSPPADQLAGLQSRLETDRSTYRAVFLRGVAAAYRSRFSPQELIDLAAFYASPLGRKVQATQAPLQDDLGRLTRDTGIYIGITAAHLLDQPAQADGGGK